MKFLSTFGGGGGGGGGRKGAAGPGRAPGNKGKGPGKGPTGPNGTGLKVKGNRTGGKVLTKKGAVRKSAIARTQGAGKGPGIKPAKKGVAPGRGRKSEASLLAKYG